MNSLQAYIAVLNSGMDFLSELQGVPAEEIEKAPDKVARMLLRLRETYFGPTSSTGKQRKAISLARGSRHSLTALEIIEEYAGKIKHHHKAWDFRVQMCATHAGPILLEKIARKKLRELATPKPPAEGVKVYRRADKPWTLAVTAPQAQIADLYAAVINEAKESGETPQVCVQNLVFGRAQQSQTVLTTNVVVTLEELEQIRFDDTCDEVQVRMTNGAWITGAEYVQRRFTEFGYATLISPMEGPVNAYRTSRVANSKQRMMAYAESQTCSWPGCNMPAKSAQMHHMEAYKHGGDSNAANFTPLCSYHNGVNDDDPNAPPSRGRMERRDGKVVWVPPWDGREDYPAPNATPA